MSDNTYDEWLLKSIHLTLGISYSMLNEVSILVCVENIFHKVRSLKSLVNEDRSDIP